VTVAESRRSRICKNVVKQRHGDAVYPELKKENNGANAVE
jgi:hypothetical protein